MSEAKRIELTTVKNTGTSKKVKRKARTFRLELRIGESNSTSCPEYSYADLIKAERELSGADHDSLFSDNEDREVAAIAQRFEAKYGAKSFKAGKKKRTQDMDDYCDVGDGYDDQDPFIDNSEAYDEVVPSSLTTKYGGFYINQGKLVLKSIDEDSNELFDAQVRKKKKRVIESDDEDESGSALAKKFKVLKKKKLLEGRESGKKKGKVFKGDLLAKKKKKNLLRLKHKARDSLSSKDTPVAVTVAESDGSISRSVPAANTVSSPVSVVNGTHGTNPLADDKLLNGTLLQAEEKMVSEVIKDTTQDVSMKEVKEESSSPVEDDRKKEESLEGKNTPLPPDLPSELTKVIETIKQLAQTNTESKGKFFSGKINEMLLIIETECQKLSKGQKSSVFNHLGEHLPCGKHALLRRIKRLKADPVKEALDKLKKAVDAVMPLMKEKHQQILDKARLELKTNSTEGPQEEVATESDEDDGKTDNKKTRMPRRKFEWTVETTLLFVNVVRARLRMFPKSAEQSHSDQLKPFLESQVKTMWPSGWMNTRALMKKWREENLASKWKKTDVAKEPMSQTKDVIEISSSIEDRGIGSPASQRKTESASKMSMGPANPATVSIATSASLEDKTGKGMGQVSSAISQPIVIEDSPSKIPQPVTSPRVSLSPPVPMATSTPFVNVPGGLSRPSVFQVFSSPTSILPSKPSKPAVTSTTPSQRLTVHGHQQSKCQPLTQTKAVTVSSQLKGSILVTVPGSKPSTVPGSKPSTVPGSKPSTVPGSKPSVANNVTTAAGTVKQSDILTSPKGRAAPAVSGLSAPDSNFVKKTSSAALKVKVTSPHGSAPPSPVPTPLSSASYKTLSRSPVTNGSSPSTTISLLIPKSALAPSRGSLALNSVTASNPPGSRVNPTKTFSTLGSNVIPAKNSSNLGSQVKAANTGPFKSLPAQLARQTHQNLSGSRLPISPKPISVVTATPRSNHKLSPSSLTPSPQMSPASPGSTAASLFDHIQSNVQRQEALQEQGLHALAVALEWATPRPTDCQAAPTSADHNTVKKPTDHNTVSKLSKT